MNKILISLTCFAFLVVLGGGVSAQSTLVVNKTINCTSGDAYYQNITSAEAAAINGDTITVCPGTYTENIDVDVSVNIQSYSQNVSDTIVNAASSSDHVFYVTANSVNISGFTVTGATGVWYAGINLYNSNYSKIENVNASNNQYGIRFVSSSNNTISNNTITGTPSTPDGIKIENSNFNTIYNNNITQFNYSAIYLSDSNYTNISSNNVSYNIGSGGDYWKIGYGIRFERSNNNTIQDNFGINNSGRGISLGDNSRNNTVVDNRFSYNLEGLRLWGLSNKNIVKDNDFTDNNKGGITLESSSYNNITSNNASYNEDGIKLEMHTNEPSTPGYMIPSENNTITNNTANSNSKHGIYLKYSNYTTITNNNASLNNKDGIHIDYSSNYNTITNNTANSNSNSGIWLDSSSNNTITNNTVSNSVNGIALGFSNNNTVSSNTVYNATHGIGLLAASDNVMTNNSASSNQGEGFLIMNSSNNNTLSNNIANSNGFGISLASASTGNTLTNNTASNNTYGIWLDGSSNNTVTNNTITSNNGTGMGVSFGDYNIVSDNVVTYNAGDGIWLGNSSYNQISNNNASNNTVHNGISLGDSHNNTVINNTANLNYHNGINLYNSSQNNTVVNNTAGSNNDRGINIHESSNNTVTNNTALNNDYGIFLDSSTNNTIYHNNIINNTNQAYDDSNNTWDNGYTSGGNYWSDWTSPDDNGDGIVDYLYPITGGANEDRYPLTEQDGWPNITPLSTEPPITTIISGNVTANQTTIIDVRNHTNAYIELLPETNSSFNITVGTATNTSSINTTSMTSEYGVAQNQKSLDEFVRIELSGDKINSTANLSWAYIRVYYSDEDLDKNGDGDADDPGDINENALKLYWFWPSGNRWMPVNNGSDLVSKGGPVVYDTDTNSGANYIWANLSHFSVYAVAGDIIPEPYTPSSGGGSGGAPPPSDQETEGIVVTPTEADVVVQIEATFSSIPKDKTGTISLPETENMPLTEIAIKVKSKVSNVKVAVKVITSKPAEIATEIAGEVLRYLKIDHENIEDADIDKVTIKFKVEKTWIAKNNIDTVALNRFSDDKWNALTTAKDSEDEQYEYYSAESPGLSVFAVSGLVVAPTQTETLAPIETAPTPAPTTSAPTAPPVTPAPTPAPSMPAGKIIPALVVIAIIAGAAYYFYQKRSKVFNK